MKGDKIKVWVTKYALTGGILEMVVEDRGNGVVKEDVNCWARNFRDEGREWHRTEKSAKDKAEEMRVKKIEQLRKQIAKLEKMTF